MKSHSDIAIKVENLSKCYHIGRNGSCKSTLLQMICRTLSPTSGSLVTNGRYRPCRTQLDWGFIISLSFDLSRQDALVDITQYNFRAADN